MSAIPEYFSPWFQPAASIVPVPDAMEWADFAADPDAELSPDIAPDSKYVGTLAAKCAIVHDEIDLEVLHDPAAGEIEIGPFRLKTAEAQRLLRWLREYVALASAYQWVAHKTAPLPVSGADVASPPLIRNPTGTAMNPPWEGETLP